MRINDPIFPHSSTELGQKFITRIVIARAGRGDLHNEIRRAIQSIIGHLPQRAAFQDESEIGDQDRIIVQRHFEFGEVSPAI